jgi:hypothetical protein
MVQDHPGMNQIYSYRRFVSVCICDGVPSALATYGIIRSYVKKHFRIPLHKLWNRKALLWSAVAIAGPDVQLAVQLTLAFLSSAGGMALAYIWRVGPRRQMRDAR